MGGILETKGKRRSRAQLIGQSGERMFSLWASSRNLVANKVDDDFGIDFYCQVFKPITKKTDEALGSILAAQVRATKGRARPRIVLSREDADNLLRQTHPCCLFAVNLASEVVSHQFINETFVRELVCFLASGRATFSISVDNMTTDVGMFDSDLTQAIRPAFQSRLRILEAELRAGAISPGTQIRLQQNTSGSRATVAVQKIEDVFDFRSDGDHREVLRRIFFDESRTQSLPEEAIRGEFNRIFDLADQSVVVGGGSEVHRALEVRRGGESATVPALVPRPTRSDHKGLARQIEV
jgi:hypothetical protein